MIGGVGVAVTHYLLADSHYPGYPEVWYASIGFGSPFIAAGALAVIGVFLDARWLWWAAGAALTLCSLAASSLLSLALFPLIVAGIVLVIFGSGASSLRVHAIFGSLTAIALIMVFAIMLFHQDPATWDGGSSGNIITTTEATWSIVVSSAVVVIGAVIAVASRREAARDVSS